MAGAEVRSSSACVSESRVPSSPKCAPQGWREGAGKRSGCRAAPRPGPRHNPRGIGEEEGPLAGGQPHTPTRPHTHPHPPIHTRLLPRPPPLPCVPGSRAAPPLPSAVHTVLFNKTTLRTAPSTRTGRDPGQRPARRQPRPAPRAPSRAPAAVGRRVPAARRWGERWSLARRRPSSTLRRHPSPSARSDRRGTHGARGASRVNRFGAGVGRDARVGSWGPRCGHSPGCALAANASSGWGFFCRRSRRGWKRLSSSWCPWPRFP